MRAGATKRESVTRDIHLHCPDDGTPLSPHAIDGRPIASCRECHGLWISGAARRETQLPLEQVPLTSRRKSKLRFDSTPRSCPQCNALMHHQRYAGFTVDHCSDCHSTWLDAGEFDAVRDALLPAKSGVITTERTQQRDKSRVSDGWMVWETLGESVLEILVTVVDG